MVCGGLAQLLAQSQMKQQGEWTLDPDRPRDKTC